MVTTSLVTTVNYECCYGLEKGSKSNGLCLQQIVVAGGRIILMHGVNIDRGKPSGAVTEKLMEFFVLLSSCFKYKYFVFIN